MCLKFADVLLGNLQNDVTFLAFEYLFSAPRGFFILVVFPHF